MLRTLCCLPQRVSFSQYKATSEWGFVHRLWDTCRDLYLPWYLLARACFSSTCFPIFFLIDPCFAPHTYVKRRPCDPLSNITQIILNKSSQVFAFLSLMNLDERTTKHCVKISLYSLKSHLIFKKMIRLVSIAAWTLISHSLLIANALPSFELCEPSNVRMYLGEWNRVCV